MDNMEAIRDIIKVLPQKLRKWVDSWPEDLRQYAAVVAVIAVTKGVKDEKDLQKFFDDDPRMQIILMNLLYHAGGKSKEFMEKIMDKLEPEAAVLVKSSTVELISLELNRRMKDIRAAFQKKSQNGIEG